MAKWFGDRGTSEDKLITVIGDGGLAREMRDLVRVVLNRDVKLLSVDGEASNLDWGEVVLGLGHARQRLAAYRKHAVAANFLTLVHPRADVGRSTTLEPGVVVASGAVATTDVFVGAGTLLNLNATIGHDAQIGQCCVINPGATVSGGVVLGHGVLVGTGANIVEGLSVGDGAIVGAGAVVTRDVMPGDTVIGVPARRL